MTARKSRPAKERLRLFQLHGGKCHLCGGKIHVGEAWDLEHVIPFELTRDDGDENVKPAHAACHKAKTKDDAGAIAKAKRIQQKHTGARQARGTIPGSRASGWKRKLDGTVERRN